MALWPLLSEADSSDAVEFTGSDQLIIGITLASLFAYIFFLCRFGTVFPAAAADNDWSLQSAYERGRRTSWMLAKGLVLGPILGLILELFLFWLIAGVFRIDIYIWPEGEPFSSVGVLLAFIGYLFGFMVTALGVVAFCNAYRQSKFESAT